MENHAPSDVRSLLKGDKRDNLKTLFVTKDIDKEFPIHERQNRKESGLRLCG
jgi:hypothetical protein